MSSKQPAVVVLTTCRTEFEAEALARVLREHGVRSFTEGAYTAGFRAEAPGEVRVLVLEPDLERARLSLRAARGEAVEIDWASVPAERDRENGEEEPPTSGAGVWRVVVGVAVVSVLGVFAMNIVANALPYPLEQLAAVGVLVAVVVTAYMLAFGKDDERAMKE